MILVRYVYEPTEDLLKKVYIYAKANPVPYQGFSGTLPWTNISHFEDDVRFRKGGDMLVFWGVTPCPSDKTTVQVTGSEETTLQAGFYPHEAIQHGKEDL